MTEDVSQRAREAADDLTVLIGHGKLEQHLARKAFARFERELSTNKDETIANLRGLLVDYARFAGETAGACLALAMSTDHPAPDEPLMEIFHKSQALAAKRREVLTSTKKEG